MDALIKIQLTAAQARDADWLLGCPLFSDGETPEEYAFSHEETLERSREMLSAAARCKVDGLTLLLDPDPDLLTYVGQYADDLVNLAETQAVEFALSLGVAEKSAQCQANAARKSAANLADKIHAAKLIVTSAPDSKETLETR